MFPPPSLRKRGTFAMEERKYCVYRHTSPSGKVYIGITKQTVDKRWKKGFGYQSSPHFWNAIQKYGWDNFLHDILFDELSADEACSIEQKLISEYDSTNPKYGYNEMSGGQIGSLHNDSVRKKLSVLRKQYYEEHPEERKVLAERARGRVWSEESKKKLSASKKGIPIPVDDEWRAKMIAGTRKRYKEDLKLRNNLVNMARKNGISKSKAVEQMMEDGTVVARYESGKAAGRATGISDRNISRCCKGDCKHAGGYKWRYAVDYNSDREIAI